jgi:hypothetical protein
MSDDIHPTPQACHEAIDRIARTPDGAALYVLLQRRVMTISVAPTDSALRADEGERRFASQLIGLMAKGVFESGGRTGHPGSTSGPDGREQPLVVPSPKPVRVAGTGSNRRVNDRTIVPGWNDEPAG